MSRDGALVGRDLESFVEKNRENEISRDIEQGQHANPVLSKAGERQLCKARLRDRLSCGSRLGPGKLEDRQWVLGIADLEVEIGVGDDPVIGLQHRDDGID